MTDKTMSPLPIKGLTAPLLRPLPTIIAYASHTDNAGYHGSAIARSVFTAHLRAFKVMCVTLAQRAGLPDVATRRLFFRTEDLAAGGFWDMSGNLAGFKAELALLHEDHGRLLKEAAKEEADQLRDLFRVETGPCRVLAVHDEETRHLAGPLRRKLTEGCWYDCSTCSEENGPDRLREADLVLLVVEESPLRPDLEEAVDNSGLPVLVLACGNRAGEGRTMAALRTDHRYRDRGYAVLCGPLAPIRLYQAIDACRMRRLLELGAIPTGRTESVVL